MSLPQLVDQAAAVAATLAELDVHRDEPALITLPDGPGFAEAFAGAIDQDALPLPAWPTAVTPRTCGRSGSGAGPRGARPTGSVTPVG